jgi:hypothetical protein
MNNLQHIVPSAPGNKPGGRGTVALILRQLRAHAPFTLMGTATGVLIMVLIVATAAPASLSHKLFWTMHPLHVLLSALVTTAMYELRGRHSISQVLLIGYIGSVGIATLSDSLLPYVGEWLLDLPNRGIHIGFIEKWWLVNPLAQHMGLALPHDHGVRRFRRSRDDPSMRGLPVPGGLGTMLHERYSVPPFVCQPPQTVGRRGARSSIMKIAITSGKDGTDKTTETTNARSLLLNGAWNDRTCNLSLSKS